MKTIALLLLIVVSAQAQMITENFGTGANSFTIDFVSIGNPSNSADTTGYGSVGYSYNIGKYEVSVPQINGARASGLQGVTADSQNWNTTPDGPAYGLDWLQAAAFVNWLGISKGYQPAYKMTYLGGTGGHPHIPPRTYSIGVWQPGEAGYDPNNPFRNSLAVYALASENEWYKAAYFDPNKNSGAGGYWKYATGSDSVPTPVTSGTASGTSVYGYTFDGQLNKAASVSQAGGESPYGTVGQGGNVGEMLETQFGGANTDAEASRVTRGGAFYTFVSEQASDFRWDIGVDNGDGYAVTGFRIISLIPEPSAISLVFFGGMTLLAFRKTTKNKI